jgi:ABC-type nickel/cobalt efflux system permease component RcnA
VIVAALAGTLAGFVHVLSGPDHLAAVAPLASDGEQRPWQAGAVWGLGHSSGVLGVGVVALLLRGWLPMDALSSWSERMVGFVLLGIGIWGLHRAFRTRVHTHPHTHGPNHSPGPGESQGQQRHTHLHAHVHAVRGQATDPAHAATRHRHTHAAFAVGVLHGLAGSSHFLGVLPALALPGLSASLSYLGGFGAGTVVAMSGFASVVGLIAARAQHRGPMATRWLLSACSTAALLVGIAWLVV